MRSGEMNASEPRVLVVHNRYRHYGGEDAVVDAEVALLASVGIETHALFADSGNAEALARLRRRPDTLISNRAAYADARERIRRHRINVVHCHNLVPLLTTSIYDAAAAEHVPVIQAVHNFRIGCLNGVQLRNGEICERCRPGHYTAGVRFGCYQGSRTQSAAFGLAQTIATWRGAWRRPALYAAPSRAMRDQLIGWGIPAEKIVVKPHFVRDDPGEPASDPGRHALYVGRLSTEKGLDVLLDAWRAEHPPLILVGDGPLRGRLEQRVKDEGKRNITFAGHLDRADVQKLLRDARLLVMPSTCHESFGLALIEAYANGVPVVASRIGGMIDVVREGVTGLLVAAGRSDELDEAVSALANDSEKLMAMRASARQAYEARYSAASGEASLRALYAAVLSRADDGRGSEQ